MSTRELTNMMRELQNLYTMTLQAREHSRVTFVSHFCTHCSLT